MKVEYYYGKEKVRKFETKNKKLSTIFSTLCKKFIETRTQVCGPLELILDGKQISNNKNQEIVGDLLVIKNKGTTKLSLFSKFVFSTGSIGIRKPY